jgi:hypothetical protein
VVCLLDPAAAPDPLSNPLADGPVLQRLVALAGRQWGVSWRGSAEQWGALGLRHLSALRFGATQVMLSTEPRLPNQ